MSVQSAVISRFLPETNIMFLNLCLLLVGLLPFRTYQSCEEDWVDVRYLRLGCLWFEKFHIMNVSEAAAFCQKKKSQLIEIESPDQIQFVADTLKSLSRSVNWSYWGCDRRYVNRKAWWGGASDAGREVELQTKVREYFIITENAPNFAWLRNYAKQH